MYSKTFHIITILICLTSLGYMSHGLYKDIEIYKVTKKISSHVKRIQNLTIETDKEIKERYESE